MTYSARFSVVLLCTALSFAFMPTIQAADMQQAYGNSNTTIPTPQVATNLTYGQKISRKAGFAFANLGTATLEIPKNIINTINQSNFLYGFFGGFLKGLANTIGRTGCGLVDLITLPIPTKPIAYPVYIWDDFDVDTTYGESFRLDTNTKANP